MDAAEREMQVRKFVEEVWNGRNYEAVADSTANIRQSRSGRSGGQGRALRRYHEAFPDLHIDVEELDRRRRHGRAQGSTFAGPTLVAMWDGPPTGRAVEEWVVTIMHFDGDRVVREWIGADKLGLFIQLGVVDNPWPD